MSRHLRDLEKSSYIEDASNKAAMIVVQPLLDFRWDYMSLNISSAVETYTFKEGGSGGTTRGVIVITYTDSGRTDILTVARTT